MDSRSMPRGPASKPERGGGGGLPLEGGEEAAAAGGEEVGAQEGFAELDGELAFLEFVAPAGADEGEAGGVVAQAELDEAGEINVCENRIREVGLAEVGEVGEGSGEVGGEVGAGEEVFVNLSDAFLGGDDGFASGAEFEVARAQGGEGVGEGEGGGFQREAASGGGEVGVGAFVLVRGETGRGGGTGREEEQGGREGEGAKEATQGG